MLVKCVLGLWSGLTNPGKERDVGSPLPPQLTFPICHLPADKLSTRKLQLIRHRSHRKKDAPRHLILGRDKSPPPCQTTPPVASWVRVPLT